ncbi:hypothetical protein JCM19037_4394 [Geomicrobium sp. JCM 19037]|uniref:hypothetical protein n=1 Tax=unclassified Geomicrobium TaxID=2628951 RepID=UPI00045F401C|nr:MULTISPECIES: hypothetical protein [unclassified Geomicrobium]GAK05862.1 hypothetical protein JCM19037_4394 [Geomicrobium sp. JCM 19037]GAK13208.1 hypothetical protein JCM19039_3037 [Geomicrobium sp. JCM 19039]
MRMGTLLLIIAGMLLSISFLVFGVLTNAEVTSIVAQVIGFSGMVFTLLYGLLITRTATETTE